MKKIIPVLIAAICITGFQMKAEAGNRGAEVAGTVVGTVLCAGIITAAILDCDNHHRDYRHNRGHYYRERDHRHYRDHYYSGRRNDHRHNRCD